MRGRAVLVGVLLLSACGDDSGPPPADDAGPALDAGPSATCVAGACDPFAAGSCGASEGCYYTSLDGAPAALQCLAAGLAGDGEACAQGNDCQPGLFCLASDMTCHTVCCEATAAGCPGGQTCSTRLVDGAGMPTGLALCIGDDSCDLLAQTGCEGTEGCYPSGPAGGTTCVASTMDLPEGSPCGNPQECAPGHICADMTCLQLCRRPSGEPSCPAGKVCGGITDFPADIGVCVDMP